MDPRVLELMLPVFHRNFGNAASRSHSVGRRAEELVEDARQEVATAIGASASEIVFTSGATEALNLGLKGAAATAPAGKRHFITSEAEHPAVLDSLIFLEGQGFEVTRLRPDSTGRVSVKQLKGALRNDTLLVALMWANNEVGTLNPIRELGALCHARGVLFLTDGTQAVGKLPVDVRADNVDLLSMSAHKLYGPKGAGALYVRRRDPAVRLALQQHGGGHERGMRSGTLNVPGIVGLGAACRVAVEDLEQETTHLTRLRDQLEERIRAGLGGPAESSGVHLNGDRNTRLPACLHLSFDGVSAEDVMRAMPHIALSSGSACGSGQSDPSHVLRSMGVPDGRAHGSLRFGLGRFTTETEINHVANRIVDAVAALRKQNSELA
ncbi:MAG: cysteine desulfurase [Planctomycetota bacterium]